MLMIFVPCTACECSWRCLNNEIYEVMPINFSWYQAHPNGDAKTLGVGSHGLKGTIT